ncbi:hypothetical protein Avbf_05538, partial [Armadillidium vulgare]
MVRREVGYLKIREESFQPKSSLGTASKPYGKFLTQAKEKMVDWFSLQQESTLPPASPSRSFNPMRSRPIRRPKARHNVTKRTICRQTLNYGSYV